MYLSMYGCRNDINLHKIEKQLYNYEHIKKWKQNKIKRICTFTQKNISIYSIIDMCEGYLQKIVDIEELLVEFITLENREK